MLSDSNPEFIKYNGYKDLQYDPSENSDEDKRCSLFDKPQIGRFSDAEEEQPEVIEEQTKVKVDANHGLHKATHTEDPKQKLLNEVGDLSGIRLSGAQVLVATYIRPNKIGNIWITDKVADEDKFQGKCGLVLKCGPLAFKATERLDFGGYEAKEGFWVWYRPMDGYALSVNGVHCRVLDDVEIKGDIDHPDLVL